MIVEVGQYREVNKGALKAFFSLVIHPGGQKIIDCRHFVQGEKEWFSFPQKEIKKEGQKSEYIPIVSFLDKEYFEGLKASIMNAIRTRTPESNYVKKVYPTEARQESAIQTKTPSDWGDLPF